ncbi:alpha/beta hydrolase [Patescibacteria group bacterium]|nr:alpha/beta hydrolase [Patescibacteria group bacterium]MBU4367931.1 alpha/beta hydrolase [Patescibacteria group bacterium]MBU4462269.1 alpha/beta hydrolase [Patescibacteria group bacterium]MCG2699541.1 alpha/beta hydrolase [Candidatus Parcubacteria bacterium]
MKTLVILHGWQSSKEKWQKIKEKVDEQGIKVIVPDIPGFKPENELKKPWDLDNYIDWFKEFLSSENISEPFFLLGHSFGGALATKFVLKYPEKVEKLFLVAAACVRKKTLKRKIFAYFSKIIKKFSFLPFYPLFRKATYKFIIRNSDYLQVKGFLEDTYLNIIKEDLSPVLCSIKIPTILIWGDKDRSTPVKHAYFINKQIAGSKLIIIPGGTHNLRQEMPEVLIQKILENL